MSRTEGHVCACRLTGTVGLHIPHSFPEADSPPGNAPGSWARSPAMSAKGPWCPSAGGFTSASQGWNPEALVLKTRLSFIK